MHDLHHRLVLAFHGCDQEVANNILDGAAFKKSSNDYDWLGEGIYFWERDPKRALEFATDRAKRRRGTSRVQNPAVIGAVLALGYCLDVTSRAGASMLAEAYGAFADLWSAAQSDDTVGPMPQNSEDKLRRKLDCAVINFLHGLREETGLKVFDTVRGVFEEGNPVYPGAGFRDHTHVQIAVRNPDCILGTFRVSDSWLA